MWTYIYIYITYKHKDIGISREFTKVLVYINTAVPSTFKKIFPEFLQCKICNHHSTLTTKSIPDRTIY